MNVSLYSTRILAKLMHLTEQFENAYENLPEYTGYWAFIDLKDSSNFRISHGPKEGYVRGETFFSLVKETISSCGDIRLIKEIGDEVLLSCPEIRYLFESVLIISFAADSYAFTVGSDNYPFGVRCAIGFGPTKRLIRDHDDFIGTSIDRLSRIKTIRDSSDIIIQDNVFLENSQIFDEYKECITISEAKMLPSSLTKGLLGTTYYREISVDHKKLSSFKNYFVPWKTPVSTEKNS